MGGFEQLRRVHGLARGQKAVDDTVRLQLPDVLVDEFFHTQDAKRLLVISADAFVQFFKCHTYILSVFQSRWIICANSSAGTGREK